MRWSAASITWARLGTAMIASPGRGAATPATPWKSLSECATLGRHRRHDHTAICSTSSASSALTAPASTICRSPLTTWSDDVSLKSLKVLDKKLEMLSPVRRVPHQHQLRRRRRLSATNDALVIGKRAIELGFTSTMASFTTATDSSAPQTRQAKVYER